MSTRVSNQAIDEQRTALIAKRQALVAQFAKAATEGRQRRLTMLSSKIEQTNEFLSALKQIEEQKKIDANVSRFAVSSLFLHESFRKLTADRNEEFFFITGSEIDGTFVLDQWAEFKQEQRTMVAVTADQRSSHRLLIKLERFGHRLLGHFHSHPGVGADSTNPSGTDQQFQKRLESAGHLAVMVIFSRDGFIRFIRLDQNFEINIYGEGVERHAKNIFRLTNIHQD